MKEKLSDRIIITDENGIPLDKDYDIERLEERDHAIFLLHLTGKYTSKDIGRMYHLDRSTVSYAIKKQRNKWKNLYRN